MSRRVRHRLSKPAEFRVLGELLEPHKPGMARVGHLLERSTRLMDTAAEEYIDAYITVDNTSKPIYVSQDTTRAIVADAWSRLEQELVDANAAFNATADAPHERISSLMDALNEASRYADVIFWLTPMPEADGE